MMELVVVSIYYERYIDNIKDFAYYAGGDFCSLCRQKLGVKFLVGIFVSSEKVLFHHIYWMLDLKKTRKLSIGEASRKVRLKAYYVLKKPIIG